jgi:peptide/nickel transport system substrate-binding protein
VNLAVDRAQIVNILGGPDSGQATCQFLPPNFPSYERYCPYTSDPSADGEWTGPDLERARRLIAASGTKGTKVTVWGLRSSLREFYDYIVSLLTDLGYDVNQRLFGDFDQLLETVTDPRTRAQIVDNGWAADYPSPESFFEPLLTCDSYRPRSHTNINLGGFCDKHIDSLITRASKLQVSDPAAARDLWTRIDAAIVDRAPYLFLFNPRSTRLLSERVGNFQYSQASAVLYEQLWVR